MFILKVIEMEEQAVLHREALKAQGQRLNVKIQRQCVEKKKQFIGALYIGTAYWLQKYRFPV